MILKRIITNSLSGDLIISLVGHVDECSEYADKTARANKRDIDIINNAKTGR